MSRHIFCFLIWKLVILQCGRMIRRFELYILDEALEFLNSLDEKTYRKIMYNIEKAMFKNDATLFKKLQNGIWEFRTLHLRRHYRMFAFWNTSAINNVVIVTHGLVKKTDKVPKQEIEKAMIRREMYYNSML